ncbi:toll/interleukin-1 receptor domain-containing protein [Streptomyces hainanensis]|uniref:Toll/interleukin-1 receptor domain-containing protein n=1 Tax=Streptomyces hainanensis TaxID=402648 RepID=A0A4R4TC60_9ACTN|nr:toll/interleukin-1 receptor domain-containing protein [Streptomyces hainanensis]TDC73124.1 toll/interleukin-1 receptor domain-containing protein [Streptomyces hainanensis]
MPEVFINYRTGDGKDAAYAIYDELARRFGESNVFLAARSIEPGENYINALDKGVRRSNVLLALIGERWLDTPDRRQPGARALDDENDWVRREIEEAFDHGVAVAPILLGRTVGQLDPDRLPGSLVALAERQYLRYTPRTARQDLAAIGDWLARQVPALATADRGPEPGAVDPDKQERSDGSTEPGSEKSTRQTGGIGTIGSIGTAGTILGHTSGPLHTGSGNLIEGDQIQGDRVTGPQAKGDGNIVGGREHGGIQQNFGTRLRRPETGQ